MSSSSLKSPYSQWNARSYPATASRRVVMRDSSCQEDSFASHWAKDWSRVARAVA